MRRFVAMALALLLCFGSCFWAMAEEGMTKRQYYEKGIEELYDFNAECLEEALGCFESAGIYSQAKNYGMYTQALLAIFNADEDIDGIDSARINLQLLGEDEDFVSDLKEKGFPSCDDLCVYIDARKLEYYGEPEEALKLYSEISVMDAKQRRAALIGAQLTEKYEAAKALYDEGRYCEAMPLFEQLEGYKDSALLYNKASAQAAHEWTEATCTQPKTCALCGVTEGEALGHDWQEATCIAPKICARCGSMEGRRWGTSGRKPAARSRRPAPSAA